MSHSYVLLRHSSIVILQPIHGCPKVGTRRGACAPSWFLTADLPIVPDPRGPFWILTEFPEFRSTWALSLRHLHARTLNCPRRKVLMSCDRLAGLLLDSKQYAIGAALLLSSKPQVNRGTLSSKRKGKSRNTTSTDYMGWGVLWMCGCPLEEEGEQAFVKVRGD